MRRVMRRCLLHCALVLVTTLGSVGCDESLSDVTGPTPNLEPTFSSIQREIFSSTDSSGRPACTNCHNPALNRGGLDLSPSVSYNNLINVASRLKAELADRARAAGWRRLMTYNDGSNDAIRGLNERLGYVYLPPVIRLKGRIHVPDALPAS